MTIDIHDRLASLHIDVEPETTQRHLAEIGRRLVVPAAPIATRRRRRRLLPVLVAAALLLLPVAAFAAEDAVPGDLLYPVKRTTEWMRSLVDPGIRAEHRIAELETVIERGSPREVVTDRLADADVVVRERPVTAELDQRLDRARQQLADDASPDREDDAEIRVTSTTEARRRDTTDAPVTTSTSTTAPPTTRTDDGERDRDRAGDG